MWRRRLGAAYEPFAAAYLRPTGESVRSYPCERCRCGHRVVRHGPRDIVAVCTCDEAGCDDLQLTEADLVVHQLSWTKLGRAIARAFDCLPREAKLGLPCTAQVAEFGGSLPVILTIQPGRAPFRNICAALAAELRTGFVLLSPTSRHYDIQAKATLATSGAGFFALDGLVTLTPNGSLDARATAGELFSSYITRHVEPLEEDAGRRAFQILEKLDAAGTKPPTLLTVFRLYCGEELTADAVAERCDCSKTTVLNRLQMIEEKTGLPRQKLRRFATTFAVP